MFRSKQYGLIVATDEAVFFIEYNGKNQGRTVLKLALNDFIDESPDIGVLPPAFTQKNNCVLIVPDHWFGQQTYPFKTPKPSLVKPFIERKLKAAHPDQPDVRNFFSYYFLPENSQKENLTAVYLQDEKGYQLYKQLKTLKLTPSRITTSALLWCERLKQCMRDFNQHQALLIHLCHETCLLYFYSGGNLLFSRNISLATDSEDWNDLLFEIEQSIQLFAQKTKSQLENTYVFSSGVENAHELTESLDRHVVDLTATLTDFPNMLTLPELRFLDGLFHPKAITAVSPFSSITHRSVIRDFEWQPVQRVGVLMGLILITALIAEGVALYKSHQKDLLQSHRLLNLRDASMPMGLSEYIEAIDQVLTQSKQPSTADVVLKLVSVLPDSVQIEELLVDLKNLQLTLKATVEAPDVDQFKRTLSNMTANLNQNFNQSQRTTLRDIIFQVGNNQDDRVQASTYRITLKLDFT